MRFLSISNVLVCLLGAQLLVESGRAELSRIIPSEYSSISPDLFIDGAKQAEKFRRSLLLKNAGGMTQAEILSEAIVKFQKLVGDHLAKENGVKGFKLKKKRLLQAMEEGEPRLQPSTAFNAFNGKWYGIWDQMEVDHHWHPQVNMEPPFKLEGFHTLWIHAVQFAWIGDGFGWNIVASEKKDAKSYFILGTVYHVRDGDPSQIYMHRPHVGISNGKDRLIWFTKGEVFLEERFPASKQYSERYCITGFNYQMRGMERLTVRGNSYQAIYFREPEKRIPWKQFWMNLSAP